MISNECARKAKRAQNKQRFFIMEFQRVMNEALMALRIWTFCAPTKQDVWNYLPLLWVNLFHFVEPNYILHYPLRSSHGGHREFSHKPTRTKADIAWNQRGNTAQRGWQSNLSPVQFRVAAVTRLRLVTRASLAISSGAKWQGRRRLEYA